MVRRFVKQHRGKQREKFILLDSATIECRSVAEVPAL